MVRRNVMVRVARTILIRFADVREGRFRVSLGNFLPIHLITSEPDINYIEFF